MKTFWLILTLVIFCVMSLNITTAAPFDTKFVTWTQPNGITFTARLWGDEWFHWMETQNGFQIFHSTDGWYYYATLDVNGEFAAGPMRVEVDPAPPSAYKIERSASRIAAIQQQYLEWKTRYPINLKPKRAEILFL